jgi:hypothetical protein
MSSLALLGRIGIEIASHRPLTIEHEAARILLGAAYDLVAEGLRGLLGKEHEIVIAVRDRVSLVEAAVA